jgi:regulatory protein
MQITSLVQQKRDENKVNLYLNNEYWISITKNQLLENGIYKGLEIDETQKIELEELSKETKIIEAVKNYILIRPRSSKEVRDYLIRKKNIDNAQADKLVEDLIAKNLISDEKFARWYIENKLNSSKHGEMYIINWLAQKGIRSNISSAILNEYKDDNKENLESKLKELVLKFSTQIKAKDNKELKNKIIKRMMSRGFRYNDFKKFVDEL